MFALVNFAFSLIAVAIVMLWYRVVPSWHLILLPVCLVFLMLFCAGIGLLIGSLAVFFRDVIHLWGVVLTAWSYITPCFWDFQMLIDRGAPAWVIIIIKANPMYGYLTFMRDILLYRQSPTLGVLIACVVWALIALAVGVLVFRRTQHKFILYI